MNQRDDNDEIYVYIGQNVDIKYCWQCNTYNILFTNDKNTTTTTLCNNCHNNHSIQNVYVDEARIYFNSKTCSTNQRFIETNPTGIKRQYYFSQIIKDIV